MTARGMAILLLACLAAGPAVAQPVATPPAATWPDAAWPLADGGTVALTDAAGPNGLLVVVWAASCPWSGRAADRLAASAADAARLGIGVLLVDTDVPDALGAAPSLRAAPSAPLPPVPVVRDAEGTLAARLGASAAPHVLLYQRDGTLAYHGAFDDSPSSAARVERAWLAEAMAAIAENRPPEVAQTVPFGCLLPGAGTAPPPPAPESPPAP